MRPLDAALDLRGAAYRGHSGRDRPAYAEAVVGHGLRIESGTRVADQDLDVVLSGGRRHDEPHPPLLLVFNRVGPRNPNTVIAQLAELTQQHWQGEAYDDGFHMYDGKLPIVVTGMKQLQEHGPAGVIFRRFGRPHNQTLLEAIGNPRREAHDARQQAEYEAREREYKEQLRRAAEQERVEREARRLYQELLPQAESRELVEKGALSAAERQAIRSQVMAQAMAAAQERAAGQRSEAAEQDARNLINQMILQNLTITAQ